MYGSFFANLMYYKINTLFLYLNLKNSLSTIYKSIKSIMYLSALKKLFRDEHQFRIFMIMCLSTVFNFILVFYRANKIHFDWSTLDSVSSIKAHRGLEGTCFFLLWNLFLAWIPYWIALTLDLFTRRIATPSVYSIGFLIITWLLFFPNAPYLVTDLLHLKDSQTVPHWYDVMLFISFAWTGLMLGYCSLFEVQHYLEKVFKKKTVWALMISAIWLGGFGVYMGRFQRWNSWDIVSNPFALIKQQVHVLLNPFDYLNTLGVAVVMSGFMMIGYLTLNAFRATAK